jgi:hypothetical protein
LYFSRVRDIFVKIGTVTKKYRLEPNTTVKQLRQRIAEQEGYTLKDVRLMYHGMTLENDQTLADANSADSTTITVNVQVQPRREEARPAPREEARPAPREEARPAPREEARPAPREEARPAPR